jgi:hypothetical protein
MILFKRVGDSFRHIEDREWLLLCVETLGVLVGILVAFFPPISTGGRIGIRSQNAPAVRPPRR